MQDFDTEADLIARQHSPTTTTTIATHPSQMPKGPSNVGQRC
jgi:hypothetical protein